MKLGIHDYIEDLRNLSYQYLLLKIAITRMDKDRERVKRLDQSILEYEKSQLSAVRDGLMGFDFGQDLYKLEEQAIEARRVKRAGKINTKHRIEFAEQNLMQSVLIQAVSYFEAFTKTFHKHLLLADPSSYMSKPKSKLVTPETIFKTRSMSKLKNEIILNEVENLRGLNNKLHYFEDKLGFKFEDRKEIAAVERLHDLRNRIVHEPDISITITRKRKRPDYATVLEEDIAVAFRHFKFIPYTLMIRAREKHPDNFAIDASGL